MITNNMNTTVQELEKTLGDRATAHQEELESKINVVRADLENMIEAARQEAAKSKKPMMKRNDSMRSMMSVDMGPRIDDKQIKRIEDDIRALQKYREDTEARKRQENSIDVVALT